jgi:hypothetical protein
MDTRASSVRRHPIDLRFVGGIDVLELNTRLAYLRRVLI